MNNSRTLLEVPGCLVWIKHDVMWLRSVLPPLAMSDTSSISWTTCKGSVLLYSIIPVMKISPCDKMPMASAERSVPAGHHGVLITTFSEPTLFAWLVLFDNRSLLLLLLLLLLPTTSAATATTQNVDRAIDMFEATTSKLVAGYTRLQEKKFNTCSTWKDQIAKTNTSILKFTLKLNQTKATQLSDRHSSTAGTLPPYLATDAHT